VKPNELKDLTTLEERLSSPRLPFMQLRPLGWDRQLGLRGNIVNVPINVDSVSCILPRRFSESSVVHLALMRRMEYKRPYMFESIRPAKVYDACRYLVTTPLYMDESIQLSDDWKNISELMEFDDNLDGLDQDLTMQTGKGSSGDTSSDEDNRATQLDVLLKKTNEETVILDENELLTTALKYASGQNNRPSSILIDLNAEVLSFPTIYCGQRRQVSPALTYTDIAKSEARRYDRRACRPDKLLYSFKKSQVQQVVDSIAVSIRKKSGCRNNITAGNLLNNDFVDGLVQRNDGIRVSLSNIYYYQICF
jgi:hypothetical protein